MTERERQGQYFPAETGNQFDGYSLTPLPDYVTITLPNGTEVQVHPSRVDRFLARQEKLNKGGK